MGSRSSSSTVAPRRRVISASSFSSEQKIMRPFLVGVSKPSFIGLTASQRLRIFSLTQNTRDRKRSVAPSSTRHLRAIVQRLLAPTEVNFFPLKDRPPILARFAIWRCGIHAAHHRLLEAVVMRGDDLDQLL